MRHMTTDFNVSKGLVGIRMYGKYLQVAFRPHALSTQDGHEW